MLELEKSVLIRPKSGGRGVALSSPSPSTAPGLSSPSDVSVALPALRTRCRPRPQTLVSRGQSRPRGMWWGWGWQPGPSPAGPQPSRPLILQHAGSPGGRRPDPDPGLAPLLRDRLRDEPFPLELIRTSAGSASLGPARGGREGQVHLAGLRAGPRPQHPGRPARSPRSGEDSAGRRTPPLSRQAPDFRTCAPPLCAAGPPLPRPPTPGMLRGGRNGVDNNKPCYGRVRGPAEPSPSALPQSPPVATAPRL